MRGSLCLFLHAGRTCGIGTMTSSLLDRHSGICRSWIASKGYGFITDSKSNNDVFVHFNSLSCAKPRKMLSVGEECEFDYEKTDKGTRAVNVTAPGGDPLMGGEIDPSMMPRGVEGRQKNQQK